MDYLIIGGAFNNKYERLLELAENESDIFNAKTDDLNNISSKLYIYNAHHLLKRYTDENIVHYVLTKINHAKIVVCNDVSCGVVPLDTNDRIYRDNVGKLCCELSKNTKIVERVYFGISKVIKDASNFN